MIGLKVLSTAAAIALLLPMVAPTESFAQNPNGSKANSARAGALSIRAAAACVQAAVVIMAVITGGGGGVLIAGAIAGAVIGGAIASQAYPGPGYYPPGPAYGYDDSAAAGPPPGDNDARGLLHADLSILRSNLSILRPAVRNLSRQ